MIRDTNLSDTEDGWGTISLSFSWIESQKHWKGSLQSISSKGWIIGWTTNSILLRLTTESPPKASQWEEKIWTVRSFVENHLRNKKCTSGNKILWLLEGIEGFDGTNVDKFKLPLVLQRKPRDMNNSLQLNYDSHYYLQ